MQRITFEINSNKDFKLLMSFAEKLGLKKIVDNSEKHENKSKISSSEKILKVLEKGIDISNFGSPSDWQSEIRQDRKLGL